MPSRASTLPYRPCVGLMVMNREGLVWVGRRPEAKASPEGPGSWWQMPQGGINEGEDPQKAALRELYEETGMRTVEVVFEHPEWLRYDLPPSLVGKAWGGRYRGQKQKWFLLRHTGSEAEIAIDPPPGGHETEFDTWRWIGAGDLVDMIVPFKREVYRRVVADFMPLIGSR